MSQKNNVINYYDDVAEDYNYHFYKKKDPYPTLQYRQKYFVELVDEERFPSGSMALDIGCGPGELVFDLSRRSFQVTGMDISIKMIHICKGKLDSYNVPVPVSFSVGDIERLPFPDNTFDLVTAAGVVEYLSGDSQWARELRRVIKPGGILILNVTNSMSVKRLTSSFLEHLKRNKTLFSLLNKVKKDILKKGALIQFPFNARTHIPWKFDRFLKENGFKKLKHRYFAFSVLPYPFDTLLSFITLPIRRSLERYSSKNLPFNGTGYIVKARKGDMS
jgi:ubiquinone/menaquinone biosynthesis C-methylase UbiE